MIIRDLKTARVLKGERNRSSQLRFCHIIRIGRIVLSVSTFCRTKDGSGCCARKGIGWVLTADVSFRLLHVWIDRKGLVSWRVHVDYELFFDSISVSALVQIINRKTEGWESDQFAC